MQLQAFDEARRGRILRGVARNPSTPLDMVWRLIRLPGAAREVAWRRDDITDDLTEAILTLGDTTTSSCLGNNDRIPTSVLWLLANHPRPAGASLGRSPRAARQRQTRP